MTEWRATTSRNRMAPRVSRGKSWVLAMLAPKRGLRVAPVPPKPADLTRLARGPLDNAGRDEGTGTSIEPRNNRARRRLAVTIIRRLQSFTQWWVRLNKPHTQKFGHSRGGPAVPQLPDLIRCRGQLA